MIKKIMLWAMVIPIILTFCASEALAETAGLLWPTTIEVGSSRPLGLFEDGEGGAVLLSVAGGSWLQVRRLDYKGNIKWSSNLNEKPEMVIQGEMLFAHGALTSDNNFMVGDFGSSGSNSVVRLQKMNLADGKKTWTVTLETTPLTKEGGVYVAADDFGGAVVAWAWQNKIFAQWANADGTLLFSSPLEITSEAGRGPNNPMVVYLHGPSSTIEGAVVLWDNVDGKILGRGFGKDGSLSPASEMMILNGNLNSYISKKNIAYRSNGEILIALDIGAAAVLRVSPGFSFIGALYAQPGSSWAQMVLSDQNNLIFSYLYNPGSLESELYVYKGMIDSISGYKVITTNESWLVAASKRAGPFYALSSDGLGGAILTFTDFRKLTTSEVITLSNKLSTGNFDEEFASLNLDIAAQRLSSSGTREWGEDGVVISAGDYAQCFPEAAVRIPNKTVIFSAIDTKGRALQEGSMATVLQKVGPESELGGLGVVADGQPVVSNMPSSSKPVVSVSVGNYEKTASIRIYVNNELKFEKKSGITSVNNFNLELLEAGSYDIKVVVTDINGNESVITFTLNSPGANAVGLVGGMVASPTPFTVAAANATIAYVLANDTNTRLVIASPTGGLVMNRTFAAGTPGGMASYNAVTWDGKLPTGERAGVGIYPVKLFDANSGKLLGKTYIVVK